MDTFGLAILILVLCFIFGELDKYIPNKQLEIINELERKNKELKKLRKLDTKTIEDLQKRLEKNNLDCSIG